MQFFVRQRNPLPGDVIIPYAGVGELPPITASLGLWLLGAAALGGLAFAMLRPAPRRYTANRSRARSKLPSTCRSGPPKHYPKNRAKYALPECWMYPVHDRPHVRKAAQRFGKYKRRYAPETRKKIAARIDKAKRRFGIGEYRR